MSHKKKKNTQIHELLQCHSANKMKKKKNVSQEIKW